MLPYPRTQNRAMRKKKQRERTSSTKTFPGSGGKASKPDALRAKSCLPFLGLCTKTFRKQFRNKNLEIAAKRVEEESAHRKSDVGARGARGAGGGGRGGEGRRRGGDAEATRLHGKGKEEGEMECRDFYFIVFQFCFSFISYFNFSGRKMFERWI
jgi:hypothetical protein